jgi:hypothetical protein
MPPRAAAEELERALVPIEDGGTAAAVIVELAGERRFLLVGEASHGSREFYAERARITEALIAQGKVDRGRQRGGRASDLVLELHDGPQLLDRVVQPAVALAGQRLG